MQKRRNEARGECGAYIPGGVVGDSGPTIDLTLSAHRHAPPRTITSPSHISPNLAGLHADEWASYTPVAGWILAREGVIARGFPCNLHLQGLSSNLSMKCVWGKNLDLPRSPV